MKFNITKRIPSRAAIGTAIGQILAVAMMFGLFFGLVWPGAGEGF